MRKKIQSAGSQTEPGKKIALGKLQNAQTTPRSLQDRSDPQTENSGLLRSPDNAGTCRIVRTARCLARKCGVFSAEILIFFIGIYRKAVSPLFPACCRFQPTCSQYMIDAVTKYGAIKGGLMGIWRILRCNPFSKGGYDPVR
jgi:putative membrane protein insertion efficiency factor